MSAPTRDRIIPAMAGAHHHHADRVFNVSRAERLLSDERRELMDPAWVLGQVPLSDGQRVVDVGCGPGFFLLPLAERIPGGVAVGVDLQEEMLAMAQQRARDAGVANVELLAGNPEEGLPAAIGAVDGALVSMVLHEAMSHDRFMRGVASTLRPGGWCLVIEWLKVAMEVGPPMHIRVSPWEVGAIGRKAGLAFQWSRRLGDRYSLTLMRAV